MEWTVHEINLEDYKGLSRKDICGMIDENRKQHRKYLGEKWDLEGAEREAHEKKLDELDLEEMKLQTILEEMDFGRI